MTNIVPRIIKDFLYEILSKILKNTSKKIAKIAAGIAPSNIRDELFLSIPNNIKSLDHQHLLKLLMLLYQ